MLGLVTLWSHLLAAALYGALAIFQLRHWNGDARNRPLVTAFATVSVWAIFLGFLDGYDMLPQLAESARNLAFLDFMYGIMREADADGSQRAVKAVYAAVAAVVGLQIAVGGIMAQFRGQPLAFEALVATSQLFGLTIAAGALILVHNLYGQAAPASRAMLKFPMLALAAMWAYDLHLYTVDYFTRGLAGDLHAMRGAVLAMIVPLFAWGLKQGTTWKIQLSRAATFQSVSLIGILGYLIVMMSASRAMELVGGDWGRAAELGIILVMTGIAIVLLPSGRARAWLRVFLAKHVFEHRYDYRREWLRFTDTIGREGRDGAPLEVRIVKALADIGGAEGGLLLLAGDNYRLSAAASWNAGTEHAACGPGAEALLRFIEAEAWVLDFDRIAGGALEAKDQRIPVPAWLAGMEHAWAGVPLIHAGKLVGLVILEHPSFRRTLDWEDIDLFRTAGIQAASYLAEARGQQALADARRFDEFNRRFAFILHDIKNLVSQLSLVTRNAERHANNPEFRADMIATLQGSVRKMNDLLVRLSPGAARLAEPPRAAAIGPIVEAVAAAKKSAHPVAISGDMALVALADAAALEQALGHLVQNAIDASEAGVPVELRVFESGGDVAIEVIDRGRGMSGEFVRSRLFQPFASTKESGFGIGAYEARTLIRAMGGRLEVESAEGEGTCFTIFLPGAATRSQINIERMRA
ncbi:MAG: XrtA/PEP-CTERM system histidine kinase PrsK [Sphingosinicella sp.]|uniref:XrtA/PEP-CTERM system histidine kinase PrsK n=1 Tax=Sphingosinicella sp. TaxID=1917971 RepID=UPI004037AA61